MVKDLIIESTNLTKAYGPHIALDSLNIKIEEGATGLLGPNGAGKSTFLKTILGLIQLTSGEGKVLEYDVRTQGNLIRQNIGYMPEYDALNPSMDAIHQVKYSGELNWNESSSSPPTSPPSFGLCRIGRAKVQKLNHSPQV